MKNNNSKKFNLYTQGQRLAARVLLVVWLLVSSNPERALADRTSPSLWNTSKVMVLGILLASVGAQQNLPSVGAEGNPLVRCLIGEDGTCSAPSRRSLQGYRNTEYDEEYLEDIFSKLSSEDQDWVRKKIKRLKNRQGLGYRDALSRALQILEKLPPSENSADFPPPPPAPETTADFPPPPTALETPAELPPPPPANSGAQVGDDESASAKMPAAPVSVPPVVNLEDLGQVAREIYFAWIALQIVEEEAALPPDILSAIITVKDLLKTEGQSANTLYATVSKNATIETVLSYETVSDDMREQVKNEIDDNYVGSHCKNDSLRPSYLIKAASEQLRFSLDHLGQSQEEITIKNQIQSALETLEPTLDNARELEEC